MAQVKETMNMVIDGNIERVTVELYRRELNPYVVVLSHLKKAIIGPLELDHTEAKLDPEDDLRLIMVDRAHADANKTYTFICKTDEQAVYWLDVFNQDLHFEHTKAASNMPTLAEDEEDETDDHDIEQFQSLVEQLRAVALKAQTSPAEIDEMDDEVADMTDKFKTAGRKDRSNSIRSIQLRLQKYDMSLKVKA